MGGGKRKTSKQQANVAAVCVSEPTGSRSRSPSRDGRGRPEIGGVSGPTISDVTDTEKRRREISNTLIQQLKIQIAEKDAQIAVLQQTRRDSLETLAVSPQSVAASAAASTDSPTNSVDVEKDKARIHAAEEQAATLAATNADLQARIHASEEQAATLAAANSDLQARIPALESFLASVQKDHKESKAKFIELEASVVQLQEMVKTREIEMHAGIVEREKLSKEVRERDATLRNEIWYDSAKASLQMLRNDILCGSQCKKDEIVPCQP
ncbi:hypothetical protein BC830DRAFT_752727 [Chytriomyces sp. MP71]|nr:hypothetical protein BC830DRAFT_752727 [Chytriomyces sp. MP71]